MSELITLAAIEWINAALDIIPVWSGASHATFLHLARAAGYQLTINERSNAPNRVHLGARTSSGDIEIKADAGQFSFNYETRLRHLNINEREHATRLTDPRLFGELRDPGPYNFRDRAREVAVQIIMDGKLPDILQHMKVKKFRRG